MIELINNWFVCVCMWVQFKYANDSETYVKSRKGSVRFRLINQRSDFSFALFTGGLENVNHVLQNHASL